MTSKGRGDDAQRQRAINALPETVSVVTESGALELLPCGATVQAADDAWWQFRDSPLGQAVLSAHLTNESG